jgi:hypothetical protein
MNIVLPLVFGAVLLASAQEPPIPLQGPGPNMTPGEVQKIFDGYMISQAIDALGLTDQQFAQLIPRMKVLQDTRRRNLQERTRLMNELQRMSNPRVPRVDDAILKERLTALQELDARSAAELRRAYNALDEVLDVRQQARFRVFEEQVERKKLDLLMTVRQNQNRPNAGRPMQKRPPG